MIRYSLVPVDATELDSPVLEDWARSAKAEVLAYRVRMLGLDNRPLDLEPLRLLWAPGKQLALVAVGDQVEPVRATCVREALEELLSPEREA